MSSSDPSSTSSPWGTESDLVALLDALPDAVIVMTHDAIVRWGNTRASEMMGIGRDEVDIHTCLEFIHPDDLIIAAHAMETIRDKAVGTPIELRVKAVDGWRLVEVVGSHLGENIVISFRDLTNRRMWEVAGDEIAQYRAIIQNSADVTLLVEADGIVRSSSAAITRVLGHDQQFVHSHPLRDIVHPDDHTSLEYVFAQALSQDPSERSTAVTAEVRFICDDGSVAPHAIRITNLLDDPTVGALIVTGHDIADRLRAEDELRSANSILAATLDSTADSILAVSIDGAITGFNPQFCKMWNIEPALLHGSVDQLNTAISLEIVKRPKPEFGRVGQQFDIGVELHDSLTLADGRVIERHAIPQRTGSDIVGCVWSFRDITEHRLMEGRLTHQAFHDSLTGLANQALFRDRVHHACARRDLSDDELAVLFIDLDEFKSVNDNLGHAAGDTLLMVVADRLTRALRPEDTVARLGGDEFAVLLESIGDRAVVAEIAQRLLRSIQDPADIGHRAIQSRASIGIAFGTFGSSVDDLLSHADLAMYDAKRNGKNRIQVFEPAMTTSATERYELESDLKGAIDRSEIVAHYQPIRDLQTGAIVAFEALARWNHPRRGLLGAYSFVPFAEQCGLIEHIGESVLNDATLEAARWSLSLPGTTSPAISVNVSQRQFLNPKLIDSVTRALTASGLDPKQLILEITESTLMNNPSASTTALNALRDLGVRIAVDDFGTGYSSLAYLQQFPLDIVKIDGSFVSQILTSSDTSMAKVIIQVASSLGLECIAEGVESVSQSRALLRAGGTLAQGFHLGRPNDAQTTLALLLDANDSPTVVQLSARSTAPMSETARIVPRTVPVTFDRPTLG